MINKAYKISDVVNDEFLRVPLSLLANPKLRGMSLEAKFVYSLLLNRLTLSQKNGWIDDNQQVYLIYKREDVAETLNISYKKSISAFKELIENDLLFEERQGRGFPNLLYVLKAELEDEKAIEFSEKFNKTDEDIEENEPENIDITKKCQNSISRSAEMAYQELPKQHIKKCQNGISRTAETAHQININNINNKIKNRQNECLNMTMSEKIENEEKELQDIFSLCEFHLFQPKIQIMLKDAIERMYYSDTLKVGKSQFPQSKVRSYLKRINGDLLSDAVNRLISEGDRAKNSIGYLMSVIINCVQSTTVDNLLTSTPSDIDPFVDLYSLQEF